MNRKGFLTTIIFLTITAFLIGYAGYVSIYPYAQKEIAAYFAKATSSVQTAVSPPVATIPLVTPVAPSSSSPMIVSAPTSTTSTSNQPTPTATYFGASADFSAPYPISWTETKSGDMTFAITNLSLGMRKVPSLPPGSTSSFDVWFSGPAGETYKPGDDIYALTLKVKISIGGWYGISQYDENAFPHITLRLLLDEKGDLQAPNTKLYLPPSSGLSMRTPYDREVIFVVPETQRQFELTTGADSNKFFSVRARDDGGMNLQPEPTGG